MKKLIFIVIVILAVIVVLSLAKNLIVKASVEKGVELVTGLRLNTQSFNVGIIKTFVGIKNLRLFNPKGYKDRIMIDMPEVYVDYDLPAIMKGKVHLEEMRINLREFMVVKNEKGELNLNSLKAIQAQKEGKKPEKEEKEKIPEIQIDSLELKIGKVVYKDYSREGVPSVREFNVNLDEKYEDITNPYMLVNLIVARVLMNTTIARLANFDLGPLMENMPQTLERAKKIAREMAEKAVKVSRDIGAKATETADEAIEAGKEIGKKAEKTAKETVEKTTETIKKILRLENK